MPELPSGFDRADGLDGRLGTPAPEGSVKVSSPGGEGVENATIEELPESPEIERAEQATVTHKFKLSWEEAQTRIEFLGRGVVQFDSADRATKVLSAKINPLEGGMADLVVVSEGLSFDSPPDQFQVVPVELGVNILKHPRYFYALEGANTLENSRNQMVIRALQDYFEHTTQAYRDSLTKLISDSIGTPAGDATKIAGTDLAKRAALEIIQKYWRNEETPYIVGYQITWSSYYFRPPYLNPGGYVENPMTEASPQLPDYFYSPSYPPDPAVTIFDRLASINPQCYSDTGLSTGDALISWLRKADQVEEQRTWFKVDRIWIGSPVGFWDAELYTSGDRPLAPGDYLAINDSKNPKVKTT